MAIKIFFCYAHEDEALLKKLKTHLKPLQRDGLIDLWHDRDINAGEEWERVIDEHLNTSQIILLLLSPDFMASDYCYSIEMKQAIERHEHGEAYVLPIILRHNYWQRSPLKKLQELPTDGKPVKSWTDEDAALFNVAEGIREVVEKFENRIQAPISGREFHVEVEYAVEGSSVINAETVTRGKRLVLSFHIKNKLPFAFSIWLGADLRIGERYFYNIGEDVEVVLRPGSRTYTRFLTVMKNWPDGDYLLDASVFYGIRSHPEKSVLLDDLWTHSSLKVT
jgi:hypothetical protein